MLCCSRMCDMCVTTPESPVNSLSRVMDLSKLMVEALLACWLGDTSHNIDYQGEVIYKYRHRINVTLSYHFKPRSPKFIH